LKSKHSLESQKFKSPDYLKLRIHLQTKYIEGGYYENRDQIPSTEKGRVLDAPPIVRAVVDTSSGNPHSPIGSDDVSSVNPQGNSVGNPHDTDNGVTSGNPHSGDEHDHTHH
jgi:hypothetical protein